MGLKVGSPPRCGHTLHMQTSGARVSDERSGSLMRKSMMEDEEEDEYPPPATDLLTEPNLLGGLSLNAPVQPMAVSGGPPLRRRSNALRASADFGAVSIGRRLTDLIAGVALPLSWKSVGCWF